MKRIKMLVALFVTVFLLADCSVAQAAESGITVTAGETTVRELSHAELEEIATSLSAGRVDGAELSPVELRTGYTAYEYSKVYEYHLNGTWVAESETRCVVYRYTDGKVHLYSRTITVTRLATYDASRTYGSIVNTDGSLSYTTGDRVHLYGDLDVWNFAIEFRITPTEYSFSCYEV